MTKINIVLVEPEIPQNTGNIARTCAVTGASLHLIRPLGFSVSDHMVRRAGLDYWNSLDISYYDSFDEFMNKNQPKDYWLFSSKGTRAYTNVIYGNPTYLIFGKESVGLSPELLEKHKEHCLRIPMRSNQRCLNLSNAAAIAAYEVLRQDNFDSFV